MEFDVSRLRDIWSNTTELSSSLGSALSGNPSSLDNRHRELWNRIMYGRNFQEITPFSIQVENVKNKEKPFDAIWLKTANGAYCVVETYAPIDLPNGNTILEPAFVVLASPDPVLLADVTLRGKKPPEGTPPHMIRVISGRYKKDIIPSASIESSTPELNFSWVREAIRRDRDVYQDSLIKHGVLTKDGNRIWRSGSSIIWAQKARDGNYDVYYYSNPKHGKDGLFLSEKAINNRIIRGFLNSFAIKINEQTVEQKDLDDFVRKRFQKFILGQLVGKEPYLTDAPTEFWGKLKRQAKTSSLRSIQKVSNFMSSNWSSVLKSGALTAVFTFGMYIAGQAMVVLGVVGSAATSVAKSGLGFRAAQTSFTRMTRLVMSQEDTKYQGSIVEIGPLFCKEDAINFAGDVLVYPLNPSFYGSLKPAHIDYFRDTYKKIKPYTDYHEREWAKNIILDTLGSQHGIIFDEKTSAYGYTFLEARQANGMRVDYHPEHSFAYACIQEEANPEAPLEKPIRRLFEKSAKGKPYIGIKHTGNGRTRLAPFRDYNDFPKNLFVADPPFQESYHHNLQPPSAPSIMSVVPKSKQKRMEKKRLPVLKEAFDPEQFDANIIDLESHLQREFALSPDLENQLALEDTSFSLGYVLIEPQNVTYA